MYCYMKIEEKTAGTGYFKESRVSIHAFKKGFIVKLFGEKKIRILNIRIKPGTGSKFKSKCKLIKNSNKNHKPLLLKD